MVMELPGHRFTPTSACIRCARCWSAAAASAASPNRLNGCGCWTHDAAACSPEPRTLVSLLAPVLGIGAEPGYEPVPAEGRKLYELIAQAVQAYLLACVGDAAGLVVAEDVHWFDPSTLEVLGSLLNAADGRLLVVMTGRPGGWLPASWPVRVFDLGPLTNEPGR